MSTIEGKYVFVSAENVDEYLQGLGVGLVLRKVQSVAKPTLEIIYDPDTDQWTLISDSVFRTKTATFQVGESTPDETYDARKCQSVVTLDGDNKMIIEQICDEGPSVTVTKEVTETGLTMVMTSGEFSTHHVYKKV